MAGNLSLRARGMLRVATLGVLVAGCYTLQPARGYLPVVGDRIAFDINDVGRVALGGSLGPEIGQIEGDLISRTDDEYVIAVRSIRLLRGGEQVWNGEPVRLRTDYVGAAYERRFSTGRSVAMGALTVGSIVAFVLTRDLIGAGSDDDGDPGDTIRTVRGRPR